MIITLYTHAQRGAHAQTETCTTMKKNKNKEMKKTFDAIELDKFWSYRSLKPSDRYPPL